MSTTTDGDTSSLKAPKHKYAIIARARDGHTCTLQLENVIEAAIRQFGVNLTYGAISFSPANFIIDLKTPSIEEHCVQCKMISAPNFKLDIVPWCKEYENNQLPWIIQENAADDSTDKLRVIIDSSIKQCALQYEDPDCIMSLPDQSQGKQGLHENQQRTQVIGINNIYHELKVAVYSYLLIAELQTFYSEKQKAFTRCKEACITICHLMQEFYTSLETNINATCEEVRKLHGLNDQKLSRYVEEFCYHLGFEPYNNRIDEEALIYGPYFTHGNDVAFIDLTKFKPIPSSEKVFSIALRQIYTTVVKQIYGAWPTFSTTELSNGMLQTEITMENIPYKYYGNCRHTLDVAEKDAMYTSLKFITHILGYKISDQNYPILANIITNMNKFNVQINILEETAEDAKYQMEESYAAVSELNLQFTARFHAFPPAEPSFSALKTFVRRLAQFKVRLGKLYMELKDNKDRYDSTPIQQEETTPSAHTGSKKESQYLSKQKLL